MKNLGRLKFFVQKKERKFSIFYKIGDFDSLPLK